VPIEHCSAGDKDRACTCLGDRRECAREILEPPDRDLYDRHVPTSRGLLTGPETGRPATGFGQQGDNSRTRRELTEELQALCDDLWPWIEGEPGDVPTRPSQGIDEPAVNRIYTEYHDNRDRRRRLFHGRGSLLRGGHDDIHPKSHQLDRKIGQPLWPTLGKAFLDHEVRPGNIPVLAEALLEHLLEMIGS